MLNPFRASSFAKKVFKNLFSFSCIKHHFKKLIYYGMGVPEIYISGNQLSAQ